MARRARLVPVEGLVVRRALCDDGPGTAQAFCKLFSRQLTVSSLLDSGSRLSVANIQSAALSAVLPRQTR